MAQAATANHGHAEHTELFGFVRHGATRWWHYFTFNTDHKVIGIQYFVMAFLFFLWGGTLALLIRTELLTPQLDLGGLVQALNLTSYNEEAYNSLFTLHGTIMIFLWVIPLLTGAFGNYIVPLQIGADDMAFPKLNALSFWLFLPGSILLVVSWFVPGAPSAGWTSYPPLSTDPTTQLGQTMWIVSLLLIGTSSLIGSINYLTTVATMRAPGMGVWQMPLFTWSIAATAFMILLSTPMLTGGLVMLLLDLNFSSNFFASETGGDPLLWQHLFWFYSHPAVYIMVLPAMGIVSEVLPVFSRKPIFGYKPIALSTLAIAIMGFLTWAHHMFTSGMDTSLRIPFMLTTMIIAVPTGIKIFSWVATVWDGKLRLNTAMMFALGFIMLFTIGGLSGVMLAAAPFDIHVHDTYFIVAHLHYVLFGGSVMGIYAGVYYWFPKMFGRKLNEFWGQVQFWLNLVAFNLTFFPMHWLGMHGMPRRYAEYDPYYTGMNQLATVGAFLLGIAVLPLLVNMVVAWIQATKETNAGDNPWRSRTLEWMTSSPPPVMNFDTPPVWEGDPYGYGEGEAEHGRVMGQPGVAEAPAD